MSTRTASIAAIPGTYRPVASCAWDNDMRWAMHERTRQDASFWPVSDETRTSSEADFVVETDQEAARQMTARTERTSTRLAFVSAGVAGAGAALALLVATDTATEGMTSGHKTRLLLVGLSTVVLGGVLGALWCRTVWRIRRAPGAGPIAMRLTATGLRTGTDMGPDAIFVPWDLAAGFHETTVGPQRTKLLVLDLVPGTTAASPGTEGLDRPEVQRMLRPPPRGVGGIAWSSALLHAPLSAIDEAVQARTGGRVRIRGSAVSR